MFFLDLIYKDALNGLQYAWWELEHVRARLAKINSMSIVNTLELQQQSICGAAFELTR